MHDDGVGVVEDTGNVKFSRERRDAPESQTREPERASARAGMRQAEPPTARQRAAADRRAAIIRGADGRGRELNSQLHALASSTDESAQLVYFRNYLVCFRRVAERYGYFTGRKPYRFLVSTYSIMSEMRGRKRLASGFGFFLGRARLISSANSAAACFSSSSTSAAHLCRHDSCFFGALATAAGAGAVGIAARLSRRRRPTACLNFATNKTARRRVLKSKRRLAARRALARAAASRRRASA